MTGTYTRTVVKSPLRAAETADETFRDLLHKQVRSDGLDPSFSLQLLADLVEHRSWESLGYPDLLALLFDADGVGMTRERLELLLQARHIHESGCGPDNEPRKRFDAARAEVRRLLDQPLAEPGEIGRGRGERPSNGSSKAGNIAGYTRRRLRRDRPDLYERVVEGELSANAAAIEAGFRRRTATIPVDSAESAVGALLRRFTAAEIVAAVAGDLDDPEQVFAAVLERLAEESES